MISPLVQLQSNNPKGTFGVGDLVTVTLLGGRVSGARITRQDAHNVWVKLAGLTVPQPYEIGDRLVLDHSQVVDW